MLRRPPPAPAWSPDSIASRGSPRRGAGDRSPTVAATWMNTTAVRLRATWASCMRRTQPPRRAAPASVGRSPPSAPAACRRGRWATGRCRRSGARRSRRPPSFGRDPSAPAVRLPAPARPRSRSDRGGAASGGRGWPVTILPSTGRRDAAVGVARHRAPAPRGPHRHARASRRLRPGPTIEAGRRFPGAAGLPVPGTSRVAAAGATAASPRSRRPCRRRPRRDGPSPAAAGRWCPWWSGAPSRR